MSKLIVELAFDSDLDNPCELNDDWKVHSFNRNHYNFIHPDDLNVVVNRNEVVSVGDLGLRTKLRGKTAFWLSYYEHGSGHWMLYGDNGPPGVEFRWDGVRIAGLLIWQESANNLGKTHEERIKNAESFISHYNSWANGHGYGFSIETEDEEDVDSCWGFFEDDEDYFLERVAENLIGKDFEVTGDAAHLEDKLRKIVAKMTPAC